VSRRILIVDGNPGGRSTLAAVALRGSGYEVAHAGNALQCIAQLSVRTPSLVLLDYAMPAAEGLRFREILSRHPASPANKLIVLTPTDDTSFAARSVDALAVVPKPADGEELVALVGRYLRRLARRRRYRETPRGARRAGVADSARPVADAAGGARRAGGEPPRA
jgi:two-component system phosphate regulon response regulator PhoB